MCIFKINEYIVSMKKLITILFLLSLVSVSKCSNSDPYSYSSSQHSAIVIPAPAGLQVVSGNTQNTISFISEQGLSYNLYYLPGVAVNKLNGILITNISNPYIQPGLTNGTTYYYVLTAVNSAGRESLDSNLATGTPGVIDNLNGSVFVSTQSLTWAKCSQYNTTFTDIYGTNLYNASLNDCSNGGTLDNTTSNGRFQWCNTSDHGCDNNTVLNGTGISGVWTTCNTLALNNFAGKNTWRVPTISELSTFYQVYKNNSIQFPQTAIDYYSNYASSTPDANNAVGFLGIGFSDNIWDFAGVTHLFGKTSDTYVRCVSN